MIKAKPVIPDQYWILREHDEKIGNIEAESGGFVVSMKGAKIRVPTLTTVTEKLPITFDEPFAVSHGSNGNTVHGYPTTSVPHNAVFDVQHQLPLWTTEPNSRSWMAAGWYKVKQHRDWKIMMCPKLILLKRYPYQGPFESQEQARQT